MAFSGSISALTQCQILQHNGLMTAAEQSDQRKQSKQERGSYNITVEAPRSSWWLYIREDGTMSPPTFCGPLPRTQKPADGRPPDCRSGFRRSAGVESPINLRLDRLRRDLEFGKLRRGPAGVSGKDQPHVPRGGPHREAEVDGVARGRIKDIPGRGNDGRIRGAVG
jgi:hypothetical protein